MSFSTTIGLKRNALQMHLFWENFLRLKDLLVFCLFLVAASCLCIYVHTYPCTLRSKKICTALSLEWIGVGGGGGCEDLVQKLTV
jgi:hypothetical protein